MTHAAHTYCIPVQAGQAVYKSLNSKFIALAIPISSSEHAKEELRALRQKYFDASHVCYAWVLGRRGDERMAADAGEPAHSAGTPILHAIRSAGITFVMVAVVRYYGGTKLGVPGLIHAYGHTAELALQIAGKVVYIPHTSFSFTCKYEQISRVQRLLTQFEGKIISEEYNLEVIIIASFPESVVPQVLNAVTEYGILCKLSEPKP